MSPVFAYAIGAKDAYLTVERRLVDAGSEVELGQLRGLSADEIDLLVRQERGLAA